MTELFLRVLQMSLMAAGVVLIALPLRWLFRRLRLPALACELLWLVVAVRMLLPVGLVTGPFSVLGWLTPAVQEQTEALARTEEIVLLPAAPDPALPAEPAPSFAIPEAVPAPEEAAPAAEGLSVLDVLAWLWLAGVLAVWGYMAAAAAAGHRRLAGLCADGLVVGERPHPHRLRVRVLYPPCVRSRRGGGGNPAVGTAPRAGPHQAGAPPV